MVQKPGVTEGANFWLKVWYQGSAWGYLFWPLAGLFRTIAAVRRWYLTRYRQVQLPVPVLVVGNINVGGTGKTPLIISLVRHLKQRGFQPGVISRGYGGQAPTYPFLVDSQTPPEHSGDEPLLIAEAAACRVCVDPDRVAAAQHLVELGCDLLLSDDGMQHYRLARDLEIAVVDGRRGFGSGRCLPAGPLREPVSRLDEVDWVLVNTPTETPVEGLKRDYSAMRLKPAEWQSLLDSKPLALDHLPPGTRVHAVAGIGNPSRFYETLRSLGLDPMEHDFPDHHDYRIEDLQFDEPLPVVMTAKDAVKCRHLARLANRPDWYRLDVTATLPDSFWQSLDAKLTALTPKQESP